ncbi:MAG: DUF115 domain-containing protein [Clostridium sp.]|nr:DUF115 domain-containing protein [Clostridium sp.]
MLRPLFRVVTKPHIRSLCRETRFAFESYKNKYQGKMRCFIVANGPSLRMEDLDRLADNGEITFGMNRIYALYDRTKWRPTFYLSQDPTVIRACISEIREQIKYSTVFVKVPGEPKYDIPGAINYDLDYRNVDKHIPPDFYEGQNCLFADGRSVTYTALQLAIYMGFQNIYLLGADCNYSKDNKSINADSYPDKRMYEPDKVGVPPDMEYTFSAYEVAKIYAEQRGIHIYNCTRGGKLEVFERVDLDSLLV